MRARIVVDSLFEGCAPEGALLEKRAMKSGTKVPPIQKSKRGPKVYSGTSVEKTTKAPGQVA